MEFMQSKLKEVTASTFKRLLRMDIVMPSNYLSIFKEELDDSIDLNIDIEDLVKEELLNDMNKSAKIIMESELALKSTSEIIEKSIKGMETQNLEGLKDAKKEIKALVNKIKELTDDIYKDELTGLLNRKWFFRDFMKEEDKLKINGIIVFMDLNGLKVINDSYGHKVGDKALVFFANFIKKKLKEDVVRFAGDEFLVIFKEKDNIKEIDKILSNVNKELNAIKLRTVVNNEEKIFSLSFSFGLNKFKNGDDIFKVIEEADHNMYIHKRNAKNN